MDSKIEPQFLLRFFLLLCGLVVVLWVAPPAGFVVMAGMTVYALRGPKESVQALTLLALLLILNVGVNASLFRWVIVFAAFGRTVWDTIFSDAPLPRILGLLLLIAATFLLFAVLVSPLPVVSVLKVVTFTVGVATILTGLHRTMHLRGYWLSWFFTFGMFILLASLPLYGTAMGYARNGAGFQGILDHPQTYGPVAAPLAALLTGLVFFQSNRSRLVMLGAILGWVAVYTSLSRTAFLAVVASFFITIVAGSILNQEWRSLISQALSRVSTLLVLVMLCGVVLIQWSSIQEKLVEFLLKDDAEHSVTASLQSSRSVLVERSMDNFYSAPVTGIGFGVPSDPELTRVETGFLGLPTGASVEKGFMPSAVLEETGITGAVLVIMLLLALMGPVLRQSSVSIFWMLITCVMINAGEMVFFSLGGKGLYFWMLMGFCYVYAMSTSPQALALSSAETYSLRDNASLH